MWQLYSFCILLLLKVWQKYFLDPFLWLITGTTTRLGRVPYASLWKEHRVDTDEEELCVDLVQIWHRASLCQEIGSSPSNFFFIHKSRLHRDFILNQQADLSPMSVDKGQVTFAIVKPSANLYNYCRFGSVFKGQHSKATYLAFMPHKSFQKVVECQELPRYNKLIFITHSGACGVKYLAQLFDKLPNSRVILEPWAFAEAHKLYQKQEVSWEQYVKLVQSLIRYYLYTCGTSGSSLIIVLPTFASAGVEAISEAFPGARHVFCTGNPRAIIPSLAKTLETKEFQLFRALQCLQFWPDFLPFPYDKGSETLGKTLGWLRLERDRRFLSRPMVVYASLIYATSILSYLRNRDQYTMEAVFHQDLVEQPFQVFENICRHLQFENSFLDNTLLPFNAESKLGRESLSGEDNELAKDVFFMLRVPFDLSVDYDRLLPILKRRKRKLGFNAVGGGMRQYKLSR